MAHMDLSTELISKNALLSFSFRVSQYHNRHWPLSKQSHVILADY